MRKFFLSIAAVSLFIAGSVALAQNTGVSCETYRPGGTSIPQGFGLPWQPDYLPNELALKASCDGQNINVEAGNGSSIANITTQYVYTTGYHWQNSKWNQIAYQCDTQVASGVWCPGKVHAAIQNPQDSFYVAYMCTWITSGNSSQNTGIWHCGCQDGSCATPSWQIQGWKRMAPTPTPGQNATGTVTGTAYSKVCGGIVPSANCNPQLASSVGITVMDQNQNVVGTTNTANDGTFRMVLAPGSYIVTFSGASNGTLPVTYDRKQFTIQAGQTTQVDISATYYAS